MAEQPDSKFRNWTAVQDLMPGDSVFPLRIGGEYFLNMRSGGKALEVAVPQGINPDILLMNLVDIAGDGGDWIAVSTTLTPEPKQYSSVTVTDGNGDSVSMDVEFVH